MKKASPKNKESDILSIAQGVLDSARASAAWATGCRERDVSLGVNDTSGWVLYYGSKSNRDPESGRDAGQSVIGTVS